MAGINFVIKFRNKITCNSDCCNKRGPELDSSLLGLDLSASIPVPNLNITF